MYFKPSHFTKEVEYKQLIRYKLDVNVQDQLL